MESAAGPRLLGARKGENPRGVGSPGHGGVADAGLGREVRGREDGLGSLAAGAV